MIYYYVHKSGRAMTASGSFTIDRRRWMQFTVDDVDRMTSAGARPYGATMGGTFEGYPDPAHPGNR
jgi:hypothetical protein